jgi:hypothetical protein
VSIWSTAGARPGDRWVTEFTANCYHQTCDEWRADFDLRGAAQDVALYYISGRRLGLEQGLAEVERRLRIRRDP